MKLSVRVAATIAIPLLGLTAAFGYVEQERSRDMLRAGLIAQGRAIAMTTRHALESALRDSQPGDVRGLVDSVSGYEQVLGLRVFDAAGATTYESESLRQHPFSRPDVLADVLRDGEMRETQREIGGQPVLTFITPLLDGEGRIVGAFQILQLESFIDAGARQSRNAIAALAASLIVAMLAVVALVIHHAVSRPVESLIGGFQRVGGGDFTPRIEGRMADEFSALATEFNAACARLDEARASLADEMARRHRAETRLAAAERLASLGRLAAGLAHEIATPLTVVGGHAEALLARPELDEADVARLRAIGAEARRIARIMRGMLDFSGQRKPHLVPVRVGAVVAVALGAVESRCATLGVAVELALGDDDDLVLADPDQLEMVFRNLADNALDAMPHGGRLRVEVLGSESFNPDATGPSRPSRAVVFTDTGQGVPNENIPRLFEPFFTTKPIGRGTGLGLAICDGIVREHGGWIQVGSALGQGSTFTVRLPLCVDHELARPERITA